MQVVQTRHYLHAARRVFDGEGAVEVPRAVARRDVTARDERFVDIQRTFTAQIVQIGYGYVGCLRRAAVVGRSVVTAASDERRDNEQRRVQQHVM